MNGYYNDYSLDEKRKWEISIYDLLPILCALVTFKYVYNYYSFIVPALSSVINFMYTAITFMMLLLYIPMSLKVLINLRFKRFWLLLPAVIIPACVLLNIVYATVSSGDFSILSRSYEMSLAAGTNDETGFYFAQVNTWFGNMAVLLFLAIYIRDKTDIIKCIQAVLLVLAIPTVAMIALHPSYLGTRQSTFGDDTVFGGGLWNIGVIGFGSMTWLSMALSEGMSKRQRYFAYFSSVLFVFVGLAGISRTLILMLAFSMIVYFLLFRKDMHWLGKVLLLVIGVLLFCALETDIILKFVLRFNDSTSGTQNIRLQLWQAYLSHFKEYWLIGAPIGSVYNYYRDVSLFGEHFLPHSSVINFFVRYGIFAVSSYLVIIKRAFIPCGLLGTVLTRERICMLAGCTAYITLAFINQTGYSEPVFYIMFGLALSYWRTEEATEN